MSKRKRKKITEKTRQRQNNDEKRCHSKPMLEVMAVEDGLESHERDKNGVQIESLTPFEGKGISSQLDFHFNPIFSLT